MCEPVTITIAVAGALASAYGTYQQSKAAKGQAKFQAGVARNNVILSERAAEDAIKRGEVAESQKRKEIEILKGKQLAGFAGSGSSLSSGSVFDVIGETAELGELDALTIRSNFARESYEKRIQGSNFQAESLLQTYKQQSINPATNAGLSLVSQSGQFAQSALSSKAAAKSQQSN